MGCRWVEKNKQDLQEEARVMAKVLDQSGACCYYFLRYYLWQTRRITTSCIKAVKKHVRMLAIAYAMWVYMLLFMT